MRVDKHNEIFVSDVNLYTKNISKELHLEYLPDVKYITEGIILPLRKEYTPGMVYRGGVCDSEFNFLGGFIRCKENLKAWATCSEGYEVTGEQMEFIDETVVFGGVLIGNFEHALFECLSRLWWFCENPDCEYRFIFLMDGTPPTFVMEFLDLIGLKKEQIVFLDKPTKFSRVILPEESAHMYSGFTDKYVCVYDRIKEQCCQSKYNEKYDVKYDKVYITEKKTLKRTVANEGFFENYFTQQGYSVIDRDKVSFKEQVQILAGAKKVACTIGTTSRMLMFCDNNVELTAIACTSNFVSEQLIVNQVRNINCIYIDASMNFLPYHQAVAGVLIGPNNNFVNYLKRYGVEYSDKKLKENIKDACYDYLKVWSDVYSNPKLFNTYLSNYKFDLRDLVNSVHSLIYDTSKYHISIVGSCVLRDIFNSKFVSQWNKKFVFDSYFARTSIPSLMGKPIPCDINILEREFKPLYFEYNFTECSKNMLVTLENNQSDYILLDFYSDAYYGTYEYDDSYIKGALFALKTSKSIDTTKFKKFYNFDNSPEEYYSIWCKAFDMFMDYAGEHFPKSRIIINGILGSNKITETVEGEVVDIQQPELDMDKLNTFWESLNLYCERKYNIPVIRYDKKYTLNPNYIFGLNKELVHFHNNYYSDAFDKILSICQSNEPEEQLNPDINLIRNSNFENGTVAWSFANSKWIVKDNKLMPSETATGVWKWIWCDPIEICSGGETIYTISFDITYNDKEIKDNLPVFGIRAFKNAVEKSVDDCVYSEIVKIPANKMEYGKTFRYSHSFYPNGKFIRVAPHIKSDINNISFSNIQLQKGKTATAYKCAPVDNTGRMLTIEEV